MSRSESDAVSLSERARLIRALRDRGWRVQGHESLREGDIELTLNVSAEKHAGSGVLRLEVSFSSNEVRIFRRENGMEAAVRLALKIDAAAAVDLLIEIPDAALSPGNERWLAALSLLSDGLWVDSPEGTRQVF